MDIDSDDGSGATIEVIPQQPQVLIPGLDIVNRLQAVSTHLRFLQPGVLFRRIVATGGILMFFLYVL